MLRLKVMIVEDETLERMLLRRYLEAESDAYEVVKEASFALEALEYLDEHAVDIVITDINMPVMDGLTMARRILKMDPGVQVIVHPECPMEVVDAADSAGSTDFIRKAIAGATEPTTFAVGTEINLVNRLAAEYPQHTIFCLDPVICPCSTMYRIHPGYLAWVLEALVRGEVVNRIAVDEDVAAPAKVALERMLAASFAVGGTGSVATVSLAPKSAFQPSVA